MKGVIDMTKKLDLNKTVFELTQEYPELADIMADLGFTEITKKPMLYLSLIHISEPTRRPG